MLKPNAFRAALTAGCPFLARNPENLHVRIDAGRIVGTGSGGLSFEYEFDLVALVTDYADSPDLLFVPALAWLRDAQPDFLLDPQRAKSGFTFEVDALDGEMCDIEIRISGLTERVLVTQRLADDPPAPDGLAAPATVATIRHVAEPPVDPLRHIGRWELWIGGEKVRESDVPPFDGPVTAEAD